MANVSNTTHANQTVSEGDVVSLLMVLIEKNDMDKIRLLLKHERGENAKFAMSNGWSCAFTVIKMGNLEVLKILVDQGANLLSTAIDGMNLLQYANFKGNEEYRSILAEKGTQS